MKLPRNLNGEDLARHLESHWQFRRVHQSGSHIILDTDQPSHQRISIPAHKPLRVGTLNKILAVVAAHKKVGKDQLLSSW